MPCQKKASHRLAGRLLFFILEDASFLFFFFILGKYCKDECYNELLNNISERKYNMLCKYRWILWIKVTIFFRPGSLLTTLDLTSRGFYNESIIRTAVEKPVNDGAIGDYKTSPVGFTFRELGGTFTWWVSNSWICSVMRSIF